MDDEVGKVSYTWRQIEKLAQNRTKWPVVSMHLSAPYYHIRARKVYISFILQLELTMNIKLFAEKQISLTCNLLQAKKICDFDYFLRHDHDS